MSGPARHVVADTADFVDYSGGGTVVAFLNEVAGGRKLTDGIRRRVEQGADRVVLVAPQNQPTMGQIVTAGEMRDAALSRVEVTATILANFGIGSEYAVFDPEPDLAIEDAIRAYEPDEVLVSCLAEERFGVQRRDLVQHAEVAAGPDIHVTHIPVRIEDDAIRWDVVHSLVVATRTLADAGLVEYLKKLHAETPHRFTIISPPSGEATQAEVRSNLANLLTGLYRADIDATGQPMSPDPLNSVETALKYYRVDDIIVSTLAGGSSPWLEGGLLDKLRGLTDKPINHIEGGE